MFENERPTALRLDPWAASSLLQKAIRRGERSLAEKAATAFYRHRGPAVWRRLVTIALEDVGPANPELVAEVSFLAGDKQMRAIAGAELELIHHVCEKLVLSAKDRSADYLFCAATKLARGKQETASLAQRPTTEQVAVASDPEESLLRRAAAALLCCTPGGQGRTATGGACICELARALEDRGELRAVATLEMARKGAHPFTLMLPLLLSDPAAVRGAETTSDDPLPPLACVDGIPLYAFDKHTALGKQAVRLWLHDSRELRELVGHHAVASSHLKIVEMAAFYADAIPLRRRFDWARSQELQALGMHADMSSVGCSLQGVEPIIRYASANIPELNEQRRGLLMRRR